jgi:hypothetical protein
MFEDYMNSKGEQKEEFETKKVLPEVYSNCIVANRIVTLCLLELGG